MAKSRAELKARFQTNKIPSETDFANLIDAAINQADDGVRKSPGDPLNIKGEGITQELLAFYKSFEERQTPAWKISQNPGTNNTPGLNIATGDGKSRLFIDERTGAVSIGGSNPITTPETCTLQLGDEGLAESNGQLLLIRMRAGGGNRAYKFGINDQHHLSIGDFAWKGQREYKESLVIECNTGRTSIKRGLEVNDLLDAKGNATIAGTLVVGGAIEAKSTITIKSTLNLEGDFNIHQGFNMKGGIMKWGDGPVEPTADPGIYSTTRHVHLKLATNDGPILFFNNLPGEPVSSGAPTMVVAHNKSVGIGTQRIPYTVTGSSILQIGDDRVENSKGEIIFGRMLSGCTRSFKMGMTDDGSFSVGDFGNRVDKTYTEYLHVHWQNGTVTVKKSLVVVEKLWGIGGKLVIGDSVMAEGNITIGPAVLTDINARLSVGGVGHFSGLGTTGFNNKQGAYIAWNRSTGSMGETNFVNNRGSGSGGFKLENAGTGESLTTLAHFNNLGDLFLKGDYKGNGAIKDSSDFRIKRNVQSADGIKDLAMLNKLRITNYDYLGTGKVEYRKGVIAQEVEKIIPNAISQDSSFTADIFARPVKITTIGDEVLMTMAQPHHLASKDLVRFILPYGDTECTVTVVDEKSFRLQGSADHFKDVLVFGKQVNDFRRVNYSHLFTLNLSATQELSKKIDVLLAWKASLEKNLVLAD